MLVVSHRVENLAAGADLVARAFFRAPYDLQVLNSVQILPELASAGIDGANSLLVTLRNITKAEDIATVTTTAQLAANVPLALALAAAAADVSKDDVLGIIVTQGATADSNGFVLQFEYQRHGIGFGAGPAWAG